MARSRRLFIAIASAIVMLGIISVMVFSSLLPSNSHSIEDIPSKSTSTITPKSAPIISIQGLKQEYAANEPVNFDINIQGSEYFCSVPDVKWLHADSREVAYDIPEVSAMPSCKPESGGVNVTLTLQDYMAPYKPIVPYISGNYVLLVELEGYKLEKSFVVGRYLADLDWQPDQSLVDMGRAVIQPKTYFDENWSNTIAYCVEKTNENPWGERDIPYGDRDNPIILKRNGDEVSIQFCAQSDERDPRTWNLMARDNRIDPRIEAEPNSPRMFDNGALGDGVKTSFDKSQLSFGGVEIKSTNPEEQLSRINEDFTLYLSADSNTKLGDKGFYLLAIRQPEYLKEPIPVMHINLFIRVVD